MIRATAEILLGGFADGRRTIGHMYIANISDLDRGATTGWTSPREIIR